MTIVINIHQKLWLVLLNLNKGLKKMLICVYVVDTVAILSQACRAMADSNPVMYDEGLLANINEEFHDAVDIVKNFPRLHLRREFQDTMYKFRDDGKKVNSSEMQSIMAEKIARLAMVVFLMPKGVHKELTEPEKKQFDELFDQNYDALCKYFAPLAKEVVDEFEDEF